MEQEYSVTVCKELEQRFHDAKLHRPMRVERYDEGTMLYYDVGQVGGPDKGKICAVVEKFVGGGFAGQVYRVKILEVDNGKKAIGTIKVGGTYAMKILIPPSGFSRIFRNTLYRIGFQGTFQLQVNPVAARAGALWQKFIRRGAKIRFGDENSVVDIYGTFVDYTLGSCGELSEWVDGRTWRLEVDDHLDYMNRWLKSGNVDPSRLGSPEYRAKYEFMHAFVKLLHDMGGHEFARQYEWSTCKSQPNCLKRKDTEDDPSAGLTAVDFRAGLTLLPFLPMSPGDFKLIFTGLARGSIVQFDRGSISKLERFIEEHGEDFSDMYGMLDELKESEHIYRNSVPDITHNHVRLFFSKQLWSTMIKSMINGWKIQNIVDDSHAEKLGKKPMGTTLFALLGLVPLLGIFFQRIFGQSDWRKHYKEMFTNINYLKRAFKGRIAEKVICFHRDQRITGSQSTKVATSGMLFTYHLILSLLPVGFHRMLSDRQYAKERLVFLFIRPVRLYFNADMREQWLRDMVTDGKKNHILSHEDADIILSQVDEPFIQKYLKSLAVHVCTLPVTQIVSITVAIIYVMLHPEIPRAQAWGIGLGIIALFQVVPISPGSLTRGLYVVYLVVKERNIKDYNIAVILGFFKYIGYLAFPIQMAYRYPVLAQFMAGHWARESVHVVPVFGETGALLEHWVFCLFYNWPLTLRRRIRNRIQMRKGTKKRYWHIGLCAIFAAGMFGITDYFYYQNIGMLPELKTIWWLSVIVPMICGVVVTLGCGGATMGKRITGAAACGAITGILYTAVTAIYGYSGGLSAGEIISNCMWRIFIFSIFSLIGAAITELKLTDPDLKR